MELKDKFMRFFNRCKDAGLELTFYRADLTDVVGLSDEEVFEALDTLQIEGKITLSMNSYTYEIELI